MSAFERIPRPKYPGRDRFGRIMGGPAWLTLTPACHAPTKGRILTQRKLHIKSCCQCGALFERYAKSPYCGPRCYLAARRDRHKRRAAIPEVLTDRERRLLPRRDKLTRRKDPLAYATRDGWNEPPPGPSLELVVDEELEDELGRLLRSSQASGMLGYVLKAPAPRYAGNPVYQRGRYSPILRALLMSTPKRRPGRSPTISRRRPLRLLAVVQRDKGDCRQTPTQ
jgi:hypothetical protein